jgi:hypothetical protein
MRIELNGLEQLRLLSAYHALRMPSGSYGLSHERAREIVVSLIGYCPEDVHAAYDPSFDGCLAWLGIGPELG